ncbi:hypothetical protein D3C83_54800 [compost metagenome]
MPRAGQKVVANGNPTQTAAATMSDTLRTRSSLDSRDSAGIAARTPSSASAYPPIMIPICEADSPIEWP